MFITNKSNQLVRIEGSKLKTIYPDKIISIVFNIDKSCIFTTEGMICKYDTDENFKILFHREQKVISIHETQCVNNMVIITYEDQAIILSPRVKIGNPMGRIEYYCEKFIIYKTSENFISVSQNNVSILFPSDYHVRFINRVTPVTDMVNINIHVYGCSNDILEHRIYWTNGTDCKLTYTSSINFNGIVHTHVCHRKSYHIIDNDSVLHTFYEDGGGYKQCQLDDYRIVDKCVIDYKKPIKIHKLI